jgi:hypothetical protein
MFLRITGSHLRDCIVPSCAVFFFFLVRIYILQEKLLPVKYLFFIREYTHEAIRWPLEYPL